MARMEIYEPAEDSYLLQKYVKKYAKGRVLDVGTGSGIQAITAAKSSKVREVLAVDINSQALEQLKNKSVPKIRTLQSDLFANVSGHFDLIIFNPPYLPQDKGIADEAIYGGKKGWEISERFLEKVADHLSRDGFALFLFSSLTDKKKIDQIIEHNLLVFETLGQEKHSFETLYVYEVQKSDILNKLKTNHIENVKYFTKGKRGLIFIGFQDKNKFNKKQLPTKKNLVKVAIKVERKESKADGRAKNEAKWLKILNQKGIGPKLLFSGETFLVYQFVEGDFILDWMQGQSKKEVLKILQLIFNQCFVLDQLGVNKEEMHHPLKHIIIDSLNLPVLLDFERCHRTDSPKNVTQFIEFICRIKNELKKKQIKVDVKYLRDLAKRYKQDVSKKFILDVVDQLK